MLLKLTLSDAAHQPRGSVRMKLDWSQKRWFLAEDDPLKIWRRVGFSRDGSFERKPWGVIWLWDQQHNTVIFWDAPTSETVSPNNAGKGLIFDPSDPAFKDGRIDWTIEKSVASSSPPPLSPLRIEALGWLDKILPAPYGSPKWSANPFHSEQPGPVAGYTNCVEFPGYLLVLLKGKKLVGYPPVTTPGWRNADETDQLPRPGDIYVLCKTAKRDGTTAHVGVIYSTSWNDPQSLTWRTGDWGQGDVSWDGNFVVRRYNPDLKTLSEKPGDTRLPRVILGWLDLDEYFQKTKG